MRKKKNNTSSCLGIWSGSIPKDMERYVHRLLCLMVIVLLCFATALEAATSNSQETVVVHNKVPSTRKIEKTVFSLVDSVIRTAVFLGLSGVFAGLTIGIMCVDTLTLDVIAASGPEPDRTYASRILPLRRGGHRTLCTLILSNMLMNVLVVQEVDAIMDAVHRIEILGFKHTKIDFSNPFFKFGVSTVLILVFTEIIPMSICKSKYSLKIAAAGSGLVRLASILAYLVAVPFGALLDYFVPHDAGQIYDRRELRKLMALHCEAHGDRSGLATSELKLLMAAMDFHEKKVKDIMTPIEHISTVNIDQEITADFMNQVWSSGRSRFPVMSGPNTYTDVLLVKDLPTAKALGVRTIGELTFAKSRGVTTVKLGTSLPSVLRFFQESQTHILLVSGGAENETGGKSVDDALATETCIEGGKYFQNAFHRQELTAHVSNIVGVVTLEDVVEELIKEEIYDEYDVHATTTCSNSECVRTPGTVSVPMGISEIPLPIPEPEHQPRANFYSFLTHPDVMKPLTNAQVWTVAYFMTRAVPPFFLWDPGYVKMLLDECGDEQLIPSRPHSEHGSMQRMHVDSMESNVPGAPTPTDNMPFSSPACHDLPIEAVRRSHEDFLAQASEDRFVLYRTGKETQNFTLILGGRVEVLIGSEGFPDSRRSFAHLGVEALRTPYYASDFSAVVLYPARLYKISKQLYEKYLFYNNVLNGSNEHKVSVEGKTVDSYCRRSYPQVMEVQSTAVPQTCEGDSNVSEENKGLLADTGNMYGTFALH